jgi:hypothetical protein
VATPLHEEKQRSEEDKGRLNDIDGGKIRCNWEWGRTKAMRGKSWDQFYKNQIRDIACETFNFKSCTLGSYFSNIILSFQKQKQKTRSKI